MTDTPRTGLDTETIAAELADPTTDAGARLERAVAECQATAARAAIYPGREADLRYLIDAGLTADRAERVVAYLAHLNAQDEAAGDSRPQALGRRYEFFEVDKPSRLPARYVRLVAASPFPHAGRSAVAFVEIATGILRKPDGWKRPAKGARGHFATDAGLQAVLGLGGNARWLYAR